jgi:hypothetical protein
MLPPSFLDHLPPSPGPRDYLALTDESCITKHRHMVIGGVSLATRDARWISEELHKIRVRQPFPGDSLQWKTATWKKAAKYEAALDFFHELNREHILDFHAVVFESRSVDHKTYSDGNSEDGFYKFVFQSMFSHFFRYWAPRHLRCIHGPTYRPFRRVEYGDMRETPLLQLADILIGAVAHEWNRKSDFHTESVRTHLANRLRSECPASVLCDRTPANLPHFDIWQFRLRAGAART